MEGCIRCSPNKGNWEWMPTFFVLLASTCCLQAGSQLFVPHVKLVRTCLILLEVTQDYCWMLLCPAQSVRSRATQTLARVIGYFKWVLQVETFRNPCNTSPPHVLMDPHELFHKSLIPHPLSPRLRSHRRSRGL